MSKRVVRKTKIAHRNAEQRKVDESNAVYRQYVEWHNAQEQERAEWWASVQERLGQQMFPSFYI